MIVIYQKHLYDEWYNSLTDEEKLRLEEFRKAKQEKREREARAAIQRLAIMTGIIQSHTSNKYGNLYDKFGFPRL